MWKENKNPYDIFADNNRIERIDEENKMRDFWDRTAEA